MNGHFLLLFISFFSRKTSGREKEQKGRVGAIIDACTLEFFLFFEFLGIQKKQQTSTIDMTLDISKSMLVLIFLLD